MLAVVAVNMFSEVFTKVQTTSHGRMTGYQHCCCSGVVLDIAVDDAVNQYWVWFGRK